MYLCLDESVLDTSRRQQPPAKLVYGYIDGKKTECMTETELLALFGEHEYREQSPVREAEMKEMAKSMQVDGRQSGVNGTKKLQNAKLHARDLSNIDLSNADLRNADLSGADLRGADLSGADLSGANLRAAYCKGVDFSGANLTGAVLDDSYLTRATLFDAKGIDMESIRNVRNLHAVRMDSVMIVEIQKYHPSKFKDPGWRWDTNVWVEDKVKEAVK
jgi:hypothetical protein